MKKVPALFGKDIFLFFPPGNSLDSVSGLQGTLISPHAQLPVLLRYKDTVLCNKARHGGPKDTSKSIDTNLDCAFVKHTFFKGAFFVKAY